MDALTEKLEAIDAKLDYVVERQRYVEELIDEMTPVLREAIDRMAPTMAEWERLGLFALLDADTLARLLALVKNLASAEILDVARETTEVMKHADVLPPVSVFGAVRAGSDRDVQRGMAVALEVLKHLGRTHSASVPSEPPRAEIAAPVPRERPIPRPPAAQPAPKAEPKTVTWRGHTFTEEGFLVDPAAWSEDLAVEMARGLGIELGEEHWAVLRWVRADYLASGASPNVRRAAAGTGVGTRRMYELFPKTPGKSAAMIAGIPKPAGCV